jgi:sugar phosphate isomerase/epimerase
VLSRKDAVSKSIRVPDAPITLSTASVYPEKVPSAFEMAAWLGYDGIEVMVALDAASQDLNVLRRLADYHQMPIKSIHAPCLLFTQMVWGRDSWGKLIRSKEVAEELGADVVVVHPPFRWQRDYAKDFEVGLERMQQETDVVFAVENMFPVKARGSEIGMYAPNWDPTDYDFPHLTLDLSHTAVSGSDALAMADGYGDRLRHLHLADGTGIQNKDEHLVPGRGSQPCGAILERLALQGFQGHVVLEVNTRKATSRSERIEDLAEALAFARLHLAASDTWEVSAKGEVSRHRTS